MGDNKGAGLLECSLVSGPYLNLNLAVEKISKVNCKQTLYYTKHKRGEVPKKERLNPDKKNILCQCFAMAIEACLPDLKHCFTE